MSESKQTVALCRELERLGAVTLAVVGHGMQAPGWPDRHVCHRLWAGWLELKDRDAPLRPLQRKRLADLWARQPGTAYVVRFWPDLMIMVRPDGTELRDRPRGAGELLLALRWDWLEQQQEAEADLADHVKMLEGHPQN